MTCMHGSNCDKAKKKVITQDENSNYVEGFWTQFFINCFILRINWWKLPAIELLPDWQHTRHGINRKRNGLSISN